MGTELRSRYKVLELIGRGGMGAVYRAEDLRLLGRQCAVKEILPELVAGTDDDHQAQVQFYREASTLARLDHPCLPKVSDHFSEDGRDYLVMDYVPGQNLQERLDEARQEGRFLPEPQVLNWVLQLCDALDYLHSQEPTVLHRDIKPGNIKLSPHGNIKLVDFGLVKLMAPDDSRTVTVVQGRGTAQYTPLEQYGGDSGHTDARTDLYSLGATFYHLLTGVPPADAKERFLRPGSLTPPSVLNPSVTPRTEHAILQALAMHPDERPASVAAFRTLLAGADAGRGTTYVLAPAYSWTYVLRRNTLLALLTIAAILIAYLVTLFSPTLPRQTTPDTSANARPVIANMISTSQR